MLSWIHQNERKKHRKQNGKGIKKGRNKRNNYSRTN